MPWKEYIDADEIKKSLQVLQAPDSVFEIRVIGTSRKDIISGYFKDADSLMDAFPSIDLRERNVYVTLGKLKEECFSRSQSERFLRTNQTTSDTEVESYRWLFIDLDPVRTAGISSSDEELRQAEAMAKQVEAYLDGLGFAKPIKALSGNGYHLFYRIDLLNNADGRDLVERCLKTLSDQFDNEIVKIDTTNYNPSRICKLHGTLAQKGRSTSIRPHRMSKILAVPEQIEATSTEIMKALTDRIKKEPERRPGTLKVQRDAFNLQDFLFRNGLTYSEDSNDRATIYKLDECPFDHNHRDGDAKIFQYADGAIAFKCHHNSCRDYKWQDVRRKYEPDAYCHPEDDAIDEGWIQHKTVPQESGKKKEAPKKKKKEWRLKTAESLMAKNLPEPTVIVGVGDDVPFLVEGTCILSAKPKLGKSWLALSLCIEVAQGNDFLGYKTRKCSTCYLDLETSEHLQQKRLRKVLDGRPVPKNFYLDTAADKIEDGFVDQIESYLRQDPGIKLFVVDVFQIIRSPSKSFKETEYDHAYRDITPLNELAQKHHICIVLVCHDRKAVDPDDPFSNILGSTGLQGAATQMIVMFRKQKDDPIHISVKGKTIDGLPELNVELKNAKWSIVEGYDRSSREEAEAAAQYRESDVRTAIVKILEREHEWRGRCSALIENAVEYGIGVEESPKQIGAFFRRHQGRLLKEDGIRLKIINNGNGGKTYEFKDSTVDTVDENRTATVDDFQELGNMRVPEEWFS